MGAGRGVWVGKLREHGGGVAAGRYGEGPRRSGAMRKRKKTLQRKGNAGLWARVAGGGQDEEEAAEDEDQDADACG